MQNIPISMCGKFHYDWLKNDTVLGNRKFYYNKEPKNKNNVSSAWGPVSGSKTFAKKLTEPIVISQRTVHS